MPDEDPRTTVLEGISLQYELALSAGRSLNPQENCTEFLRALIRRKGLDAAGVWIRGYLLGGDKAPELLWPFHFNPSFRTPGEALPHDDPVLEQLAAGKPLAFGANAEFETLARLPGSRGGEYAAFPLERVGVLLVHSTRRARSFSTIELRQLTPVISKFALTLEGSLAHQHLLQERVARSELEEALSESREMYRALYQDAPCMFFTLDRDGTVQSVNEAGASALGYSPTELVGSNVLDVFHPDDRGAVQVSLSASMADPGAIHSWTFRKVRADGTPIHVQEFVRTMMGSDGRRRALVLCHDITDRVAARQALMDSEARYRAVVQQSVDAIFLIDPGTGQILEGNQALAELLGYHTEELPDLSLFEFVDHPKDDIESKVADIITAGHATLGRRRYRRRDGSAFYVEVAASLISYGGCDAICVVSRDVTAQIAAEAQREQMEERLRHTQKLESLGVLAGGVAHDFNNILAGILGNADLATTRLPPTSEVRDFLTRIASAAVQASALCSQLLDYAGKGPSEFEATNVSQLVARMKRMFGVTISKKAVVDLQLAESLPPVMADSTQLNQIFMNLVTNASEALNDEEGTISLRTGLLTATREVLDGFLLGNTCDPGDFVLIEVQDTGVGMSAEQRSRMFDPFFTTKFTGRGLGLATVLGIVRSHSGAIDIRSNPGQGTSIRVLLPAAGEAVGFSEESHRDERSGAPCVLVADDDVEVRLVARMALEDAGMTVLEACDGKEAVDLVQSDPEKVQAMVLDMTMPRLGGREALEGVRRVRPDLPIVLCSGYDEHQSLAGFSDGEACAFLHKPFRIRELVEAVQEAMADRVEPENRERDSTSAA